MSTSREAKDKVRTATGDEVDLFERNDFGLVGELVAKPDAVLDGSASRKIS